MQDLLPSEDIAFNRKTPTGLWAKLRKNDWSMEATDVNRYCSPAALTLTDRDGNKLPLILHQCEGIRITPTERGIGAKTLHQSGAPEIQQLIWRQE